MEIIQPDENKISDVIKLLLEPNGVHGQGALFLKIFLKKLEEFTDKNIFIDFSKVKIEREKTTDLLKDNQNRRIDLLKKSNNYVIGIENKPWAGEQENQLKDNFEITWDIAENFEEIKNNMKMLVLKSLFRKLEEVYSDIVIREDSKYKGFLEFKGGKTFAYILPRLGESI